MNLSINKQASEQAAEAKRLNTAQRAVSAVLQKTGVVTTGFALPIPVQILTNGLDIFEGTVPAKVRCTELACYSLAGQQP